MCPLHVFSRCCREVWTISLLLILSGAQAARQQEDPLPLLAHWTLDVGKPGELIDVGPGKRNGVIVGASSVPGKFGQALAFDGHAARARVTDPGLIAKVGARLTITFWIKLDAYPSGAQGAGLIAKREQNVPTPFDLSLGHEGQIGFEGYDGAEWTPLFSGPSAVPLKEWSHIAFTYQAGGRATFYINGKSVAERDATRALAANDQALVLGADPYRGAFQGQMDEVRIYAAALTPEQVGKDRDQTLAFRAAVAADFPAPTHAVHAALVRFDSPLGFSEGYGRTRRIAERRSGPDAVDWPAFTWNGKPLWEKTAEQEIETPLRESSMAAPLFRQPYDDVVEPGSHWSRAVQWLWGQRYVYTTDRTARSWTNDYELWIFPVRIAGAGAQDVRDVALTYNGKTIYRNAGPLHSLTLLLPQNEPGKSYELTVAERAPVRFEVGLSPLQLGAPKDVSLHLKRLLPGPGTELTLETPERPDRFSDQAAWDSDLAALGKPHPITAAAEAQPSFTQHLGIDVPRSPLAIQFVGLPHGMSSGGFMSSDFEAIVKPFGEIGTAEDYALFLHEIGYDRVFERAGTNALDRSDARSLQAVAIALARHGIGLGLTPGTDWQRPFLAHPNLAFFSYNLPDYHAPLYRDLQLATQRLAQYGNFAGISIGADNGAYVSFWNWAPPIPNRPWGEAFLNFQEGKRSNDWPEPKSVGGKASVPEFLEYVARYDETFRQYGYFGQAVTEVASNLPVTTGSFGSSPGVGGGGGWPWATVPGREMFAGLPVLQAYDWNEQASSKPMHLVALLDRLRSYYPDKPAWALVDDFQFLFGREARQRAYALALTRGVQAIGTTFLPNPWGERARRDVVAQQKDLYDWIHRYGGVYAMTEPLPTVGILYVHRQALLRPVDQNPIPSGEEAINGGHEGKTTEALFLCQAAGWPAKIVTPEELKRGLPGSMKALLLVGLNQLDPTWRWYTGIEAELKRFVQGGGILFRDTNSICPLPATETGMQVRAYVTNRDNDWTPELLARNTDNIQRLRKALQGVTLPCASSVDPTVWVVPTQAGDVQYVTVVNQASEPGKNASRFVKPQIGKMTWNTPRPIYDVRLRRRLLPEEARHVDLTEDAFRWYALPPAPVTAPQLALNQDVQGFVTAAARIAGPMRGVPIAITVRRGKETATIYTATGQTARLPLSAEDTPEEYAITTEELLSGLKTEISFTLPARKVISPQAGLVTPSMLASLNAFDNRKAIPLVIALTPEQEKDPQMIVRAERLVRYFSKHRKRVERGRVGPGGIVLGLQPLRGIQTYPRWRTIDADLVLFGSPTDNPLLLDQQRGGLLTEEFERLKAEQALIQITYSPFVGERQVLNILARDAEGMTGGIEQIFSMAGANGH